MKLPNLSEAQVDLPQRTTMCIVGGYLVSEIQEIEKALIVAGLIAIGIICRTITTVMKERKEKP